MDTLEHEDSWRAGYEEFLYTLLEREWTLKLRHSEHVEAESFKHNPCAFAHVTVLPRVVQKEKRICEIEFSVDEQKFRLEIYTPVSLSPQTFIYRTYNKLYEHVRDNLDKAIWARHDTVTNDSLKHFRF